MSLAGRIALAAVAVLMSGGGIAAQRLPEIAYVYPAGLQRGSAVEVTVGGRDLQAVTGAHFAQEGITVEVLERWRPMNGRERNLAQDRVSELLEKRKEKPLTKAEEDEVRKLRQEIARSRRSRDVSPQLVERLVMRVTAAAELAPGAMDLRLKVPNGLSNPLRFVVGTLPEQLEAEGDGPQDSGRGRPLTPGRRRDRDDTIALPAVVNGQVTPRDVDRFRFRVQSGMGIVAVVEARSLIPYVADAVPGWFQACLTLRDEDGKVLRSVDDRGPDPDPVLYWVAAADGIYELEVADAVRRGREDFVYRLTVGELPHVSSVFPLGAQAGKKVRAMLRGVNLDSMTTEVDLTKQGPGVVVIDAQKVDIDPLLFAVDGCEEVREAEPNDEQSQSVRAPVVVNGIIDRPGDVDAFAFSAPGGTRFVAEIKARRLGSPLDSLLRLYDPQGQEVARCDDDPSTASGLVTQAADSRLEFVIRENGVHRLVVTDVQNKGSADHAYRLYVGPPQPDFTLRITPSAVAVGAGGTAVVTVHVARHDGFDGEVEVELIDAPAGFALGGAVVPKGCDRIDITVTAGELLPGQCVPLAFEGSARIKNKEVRRLAQACDDRMQAFIYHHLVPAEQFLCAGRSAPRVPLPVPRLGKNPLRLRRGGEAQLVIDQPGRPSRRPFTFELRDPPEGIRIAQVVKKTTTYVLRIEADRRDELRRLRGNLIVDVKFTGGTGARAGRVTTVATLPAIPFQIGG